MEIKPKYGTVQIPESYLIDTNGTVVEKDSQGGPTGVSRADGSTSSGLSFESAIERRALPLAAKGKRSSIWLAPRSFISQSRI